MRLRSAEDPQRDTSRWYGPSARDGWPRFRCECGSQKGKRRSTTCMQTFLHCCTVHVHDLYCSQFAHPEKDMSTAGLLRHLAKFTIITVCDAVCVCMCRAHKRTPSSVSSLLVVIYYSVSVLCLVNELNYQV